MLLCATVALFSLLPSVAQAQTTAGICDRTPAVQRALLGEIRPRGTVCSAVTSEQLSAITRLDLRGEISLDLATGDFAGLTGLERLDLSGTGIIELPAGIFAGLAELEALYIGGNKITELPTGVFAGLTELAFLNLNGNKITELPTGVFAGLTELAFLNLNGNDITELTAGLFAGLTKLRVLTLAANSITNLPAGIFAGLTSLERLDPGNNGITDFPAGIFAGLTRLKSLSIGMNGITNLPVTVFDGLTRLESLSLTQNSLASLTHRHLRDLTALRYLRMSSSLASGVVLPSDLFASTTRLVSLNMGGNFPASGSTSSLPASLFAPLVNLRTLEMGSNRGLTSLAATQFQTNTALNELTLSYWGLTSLPDGVFANLKNLNRLDLLRNPGVPFALPLRYERTDSSNFRAPGPTATIKISSPLSSSLVPRNSVRARLAMNGGQLSAPSTVALDTPFTVTQDGSLPSTLSLTLVSSPSVGKGWHIAVPDDITIFPEPEGNSQSTGMPLITGTTTVPRTLTAVVSHIGGAGGLGRSVSFQWQRSTDADFTRPADIRDATGSTYALDDADASMYLRVVVSFTDGRDTDEVLTSGATAQISARQAVGICERTEAVQRALLAAMRPNTVCSTVTSDQLGVVTRLTIIGETSLSLAVGDFAGLTRLITLELLRNTAITLPAGVFAGLTELLNLDLRDNGITTLPSGIFASLTRLRNLDLAQNSIATLPSGVFTGLTRLDSLYLTGNSITTLPSGIFAGLARLRVMRLTGNSAITTLPSGIFAGLTGLRTLDLYNNSITNLPLGIFAGLTGLENLTLYNNSITNLPLGIFAGLPALTYLSLSSNGITDLPSGVFAGLTRLERLFLYDNDITDLRSAMFDDLPTLTHLVLRGNSITNLPEGLFVNLKNLTRLDLLRNPGAPFTIPLRYERTDNSDFRAPGPTATIKISSPLSSSLVPPDSVRARLALIGGELSARFTVALDTPFTVTQDGSLPSELTMTLAASPPARDGWVIGLPADIAIFPEPEGNSQPTGTITIAGTTTVPQTLTAETSSIADEDGLGDFSYQWQRMQRIMDTNVVSVVDISGATDGTYELTDADAGKHLRVVVSFTDRRGTDEVLASAATVPIVARPTAGICGRAEAVQRALLAAIGLHSTHCFFVTSAQLSAVVTLVVRDEGLTALTAADLAGLTGLSSLDVGRNAITSLPVGLFSGLTELKNLHFYANDITELPDGLFSGLTKLKILGLGYNDITELPDGLLSGSTKLEILDISHNDITELPAGLFSGLTKLKSLYMHSNSLSTLPAGIFSESNKLNTLVLSENRLTELPARVFDGLTELQWLRLATNSLNSMTHRHLRDLTGLITLSLHRALAPSVVLPSDLFVSNTRIQTLDLHDNFPIGSSTSSLPVDLFTPLVQLEELNLRQNYGLSSLAATQFQTNTALTSLDLSNSGLASLPDGLFAGITNLSYLYLQSNPGSPFTIPLRYERTDNSDFRAPGPTATIKISSPFSSSLVPPNSVRARLALNGGQLSAPSTVAVDTPFTVTQDGSLPSELSMTLVASPPAQDGWRIGVPNDIIIFPEPEGNSPATGEITIAGTTTVPQTLTAVTGGIADEDSLGDFSYQWQRSTDAGFTSSADISGATGSTYALDDADAGKYLRVVVSFTDGRDTDEVLTSATTAQISARQVAGICGRTEAVQRALLSKIWPQGTACSAVTSAQLGAITRVTITGETSLSLAVGDFAGLTGLTRLDLNGNGITTLPSGVFADLTQLNRLHLNDNVITTLPSGIFAGLTQLNRLHLNDNAITTLPSGIFAGLTQLNRLHLNDNAITTLPSGIFAGLTQLNRLYLNDNVITTLPSGIFAGLTQLNRLHLNDNAITTLPSGIFAGLTGLTHLKIDGNGITTLPPRVFVGLARLGYLNLTDNSITNLPPEIFAGLTGLENLSFSYNDIISLPPGIFAGLTSLDRLFFTNNDITSLPSGIFAGLAKLTFLTLAYNDIINLPSGIFDGLTALTTLHLNNNNITTLPEGVFASMADLSSLSLYQNLGAPFTIPLRYERTDNSDFRAPGPTATISFSSPLSSSLVPPNSVRARLALDRGQLSASSTVALDTPFTVTQDGSLPSELSMTLVASPPAQDGWRVGVPNDITIFPEPEGNSPATGEITIAGTTTVPQTLTAVTGGIADEDSLGDFSYQWQRSTDAGFTSSADISGATGSTYALDDADAGKYLRVVVSFTDGRDTDEVLTSATTAQISARQVAGICGRTEAVQRALLSKIRPQGTACSAVTSAQLGAITTLRIEGETSLSLAAGDFAGLTRLITLDLFRNTAITLPVGVFAGLTELLNLDLRDNGITTLPSGIFAGLTRLRLLNFRGNDITTLPVGVFAGLTELLNLDLRDNGITTLPSGIFAGLTRLRLLNFRGNDITTLPSGIFAGLTGLENLYLTSNSITTLPLGIFAGLTRLTHLDLEGNGIITLSSGIFAGLTGLLNLDLRGNDITTLPSGIFAGLTRLRNLVLNDNDITTLPSGIFAGLTRLRILRLDGNDLTTLPSGIFAGLAELEMLALSGNGISNLLSGMFAGLTGLRVLLLDGNGITNLSATVFDNLTELEGLILSYNSIITLPSGVFAGLARLRDLYLQDNDIPTLPEGLFANMTNLISLRLDGNPGAPFAIPLRYGRVDNSDFRAPGPTAEIRLSFPLSSSLVPPSSVTASLTLNAGQLSPSSVILGSSFTVTQEGATPAVLSSTLAGNLQPVVPYRSGGWRIVPPSDITIFPEGNRPATGEITIAGTTTVPQTLTAETDSIADEDGLGSFNYQWQRSTDAGFTSSVNISEATGSTYALDDADAGKYLRVVVSFTDGRDTDEVLTSATTAQISARQVAGICGRTEAVQRALLSKIRPQGTACSAVTSNQLRAITNLRIEGETSLSLAAGDFAGLTRLTHLHLDGNGITTLPSGIFAGLTKLWQLYLNNNAITTLPPGVFASLTKVDTLSLNDNDITNLPSEIFAGLTKLRILYLDNNDITTLPSGIFSSLTGLGSLYLGNNNLTTLPAGIFAGLTRLGGVHLNGNNLTTAPSGIFAGLTRLQILRLNDNDITNLPSGIFAGLTRLRFLNLNGNSITILPLGIFAGLTGLEELDLYSNSITNLSSGVFAGLTRLQILRLNYNDITNLPSGIFAGLTGLEQLFLISNAITSLPSKVFAGLTRLRILRLDGNGLTTLPSGIFAGLTELWSLELKNNKITNPPSGVFDDLPALTSLNLVANGLTTLSPGIFDELSGLERLYLFDNNITTLPEGLFASMTDLSTLRLEVNPGAPFAIPLRYGRVDNSDFRASGPTAEIRLSSPFSSSLVPPSSVTANLTLNAGQLSPPSVTLGSSFTVTQEGVTPAVLSSTLAGNIQPVVPYHSGGWRIAPPSDITIFPEGNSPSTGEITIAGTTTVPQTLTAETDSIADEDGLGSFNYQWQRSTDAGFTSSVNISEATGSTYALDDADAGKYLRVVVSFTDERDADETLTSVVTAQIAERPNRPATGEITISGTTTVPQTLTAETGGIADEDGLGDFSYQWQRSTAADFTNPVEISDATGSTYALDDADAGKYLRVVVSFTDERDADETLTSVVTAQIAERPNRPATGEITIAGTTTVPQTLTAETDSIADEDGLGSFKFLWQRSTEAGFASSVDINGATSNTYKLDVADDAKYLRVIVSFTDKRGAYEVFISTATARISAQPNRPATGEITIAGTTTVPQLLTAETGNIADEDGLGDFSYQWQRSSDESFTSPVETSDVTGSTYALDDADAGKYLRVVVSFTDKRGADETFTSVATAQIAERPNRPATGEITIAGTTTIPQLLTAETGNIADEDGLGSFKFVWQRSTDAGFTSSVDISEATGSTYALDDADAGKYLRVVVSFTDKRGADETFTSVATAQIAERPNRPATGEITIAGTTTVPQLLTAETGNIADEDGLGSFKFVWQRSTDAGFTSSVDISEATGSTYALDDADAGKYLRVVVSFTDKRGADETFTSVATAQIAERPNRPATGEITIAGTTTIPQLLTAETGNIADEDGLGSFKFVWQRSTDAGFTSSVDISEATGSTYALDDADAGKYLRVVVSFTDKRGAYETFISAATAQISAQPNRPATGEITIAGTTTVPQRLTAETGSIADEDGLGSFNYQWQRSTDAGFTSSGDISEATGSTYALGDADAGKYLRVVVSFTDERDADETLTSVVTAQIAERSNRPATGEITISGTTTVPQTLTAETDSIADEDGLGSFNYQWQRSPDAGFTSSVDINGATSNTYKLDVADDAKYLRVIVSFTDKRGAYEVFISAATARISAQPNRPATGEITIAGTTTVPQRLTAETGSIADEDGLGSFKFVWQRSSDESFTSPVETSDVTGSTYALDDADAGKYLRVVVSFTDKRGADETFTSVATAQIAERPNRPATGKITIAGTTTIPQLLTAETGSIADEDGLGSFKFVWQRSTEAGFASSVDINGATSNTYKLDVADDAKYLRVIVSFTDKRGAYEVFISAATARISAQPNRPATGKITIAGTTTVPQLLTAETGNIADEDGLGDFSYQWQRSSDESFTSPVEASDVTGSTYALDDADAGKYLRVVVSFTDKRGADETFTSVATAQIAERPNRPATGEITIAGTTTVPQILTAETGSIADEDGLGSFNYQWQRSTDADFASSVDISEATGSTYALDDVDAGKYLRVIVGFADKRGNEESLTSSVTAQITARPNSPATGTITVDGTPTVPQTLSAKAHNIADADNLAEPFAPTYRWQRSTDADFTNPVDISGVTGRTYDLTDADAGQYLRVIVGFADKRGNEESLTSSVTTQIVARPNSPATGTITVDGTPTVPQTLSAKAHNIADADNLAEPFAPTYRWQRSTDADFTNPVDIGGVTGRTYDLTDADAGQYLRVIVGFADKRGNEESLTSSVTAQISARPNSPATGTITVDGTPTVPQTLSAKAHNIADADNLAEPFAPTYRWQRSTDADFTNPVDISGVTGRTYDLTDADAGQYLRVIVGFADKRGNEESLTSSVTAQIAARPNNPATGTITVDGTTRVDETLTVSIDTIADDDGLPESLEPTYQWQRSANTDFSGTPTDIPDATGESYILVSADVDNYIRVVVSFRDNLGFSESIASEATEQISAHPNTGATGTPMIAGTPVSGQTLTVDASGVSDVDGLGRFSYQWHRGTTPDFTPSEHTRMATGQSYELQDEDVGGYALVMVSFTDNKGNVEEMPSLATEQIRAAMFTAHTMKSMTAVTDLSMAIELTRAVKSNIDSPSKGLRIDGQSAGSRLRSALQSLVPRGGNQGYCARNEVSTYDNLLGSSGISAGPCASLDQEELMLRLRQALEVEDISLGLSGDGSGPNLWLHATAFDVAGSPLIDDSTLGYSDGSGTLAYLGLTLPATDNFKYGFTFGQSNTSLDLALVAGGAQNDGVYRRLSFFSSFLDYRLGNSAEYHVNAVFGVGSGYTDFKVESDSGSDRLTGSAVSSLSFATLNFGREFQLGERSNLTPSFQFTASSSSTGKAILTGDGDDLVMPRVSSDATEFSLNLDATFKSLSGGQQLVIGGAVRSGTGDLEYSGVADLLVRYQSQRFSAQLQQQINGGENERNSYSLEYAVLTPTIDPVALSKLGLTIGTDYSRTIYYGESGDSLDVGPLSLGYFGRLNYSFGEKDVAGSGALGTRLRLNQSGEVSADINFNIDF